MVSNIFIFSPIWGRWTHFDEHIFQMGWFNHQLDIHQCGSEVGIQKMMIDPHGSIFCIQKSGDDWKTKNVVSQTPSLGAGNSNIFGHFHPENWGRCSPILTVAYFSNGVNRNHQPVLLKYLESYPMIFGGATERSWWAYINQWSKKCHFAGIIKLSILEGSNNANVW